MSVVDQEDHEGDPIDAAIGPGSVEVGLWQWRLTQFQRIAGGFMILKGLTYWTTLLGAGDGEGSAFSEMPIDTQAVTIFFAVIDLITGVALWLGSGWGSMLWLIMAGVQVFADILVTEVSGFMVLLTMIQLLFVAGYVLLRFMVQLERSQRR